MRTSFAKGRVFAGEDDILIFPLRYVAAGLGVLYCHGAEGVGGGAYAWMGIPGRWPVFNAVGAGAVVLSADLGGNATWGNNTAISRMTTAYNYLQGLSAVRAGKVKLLAQSMGATTALAWAAANPTLVDRVALIIPVINLQDVRDNSTYQSQIDTAYGGTYSEATYGAAHNPLTMASLGKLDGIPMQIWYGDADALAKPEFVAQFSGYTSSELHAISGGHAETTVASVDAEAVAAFLRG